MAWWIIVSFIGALGVGIYVGLGAPGVPGRQNRVVPPGRAQRLKHQHIHWLRPKSRR